MEIPRTVPEAADTEDLGARGRTPLRLILTPREPVLTPVGAAQPAIPVAPVAAARPRLFMQELRRDTLVRMLLGAPRHAFVFVTFSEFSMMSMAQEELKDEERAGGFDADDEDETFVRTTAPVVVNDAAAQVPAAETTEAATPAETPAPHAAPQSHFPFKTVLVGLPLTLMLIAMVVLFLNRQKPSQSPVLELGKQQGTTTTAGQLPAPPPSVSPTVPAAPAVNPTPPATTPTTSSQPTSTAAPAEQQSAPVAASQTTPAPPTTSTASSPHGTYEIQVVATPNRAEADRRVASLVAQGARAFVKTIERDGETMYRVRVGGFASEAAARSAGAKLGLRSMWIERTGR